MNITKVDLVITKDGWEKRVYDGETIVASQRFRMVSPSLAQGESNVSFDDQLPRELVDDDLLEALDDLDGFDIAVGLKFIDA